MQSRKIDTDVENKGMDTKEGRERGGTNWEIDTYIILILYIKLITTENLLCSIGVRKSTICL